MECVCGEQQCICAGGNDAPLNDQFAAGWYAAFEYMRNMNVPAPPNHHINTRPRAEAPIHDQQEEQKPATKARSEKKQTRNQLGRRARREAEITKAYQAGVRSTQEIDAALPTLPPYLLYRDSPGFDYERVHREPAMEESENDTVPVKTEPEDEDVVLGLKTEAQEDESVFGLRTELEAMSGFETETQEPRTRVEFESEDEKDDPMPAIKIRPPPSLQTRSHQHFKKLEAPGGAKNWAEQEEMMAGWREVRARYQGRRR